MSKNKTTAEDRLTASTISEAFGEAISPKFIAALRTPDEEFEIEEAKRAYDEAWRDYKGARSRFMDMVLNGGLDIPADQRLGHDDLTDTERELILADRQATVRNAWVLFQEAEARYDCACTVDSHTEVKPRKP